jgi:phosphoserine phosphatase
MKKLALGQPLGDFEKWAGEALRTIERATAEDVEAVIGEYKVTGLIEPLKLRTFDAAAATTDEIRQVLATLIDDIKRGGQKRSDPE